MTRPSVRLAVALALGVGIAGAGYAAKPITPKPPPTCKRTALPGEFRCSFPTHSHLRAVVYVQTFEDGSASAMPVDPDKRGMR